MPLPTKLAAIACLSTAIAAAPAFAASSGEQVKTKEISILGFDLADPVDAQTVLKKIQATAESVCTVYANRETVTERRLRQRCADKATDAAVKTVRSATLTALWAEARDR